MWRKIGYISLVGVDVVDITFTCWAWYQQIPFGGISPERWLLMGLIGFFVFTILVIGLFVISTRNEIKKLHKAEKAYGKEELEIGMAKPKKHEFYPHRPDMETLKKFIREHEFVYAFFPMGDSLRINHFYELDEYKSKLRRVVLMDTEGKHIETLPEKYFINDSVSLIKGINQVVEAIKNTDIELKLWDGCFPYSMFIGNPLSKVNSGSILLEVITPFTVGIDRPAILFKQKDYPELFEKLQKTYDEIWEKSRRG